MKYMILIYGSQRDYDALGGKPDAGQPGWSAADFAALGAFMESFNKDLADSGELVETRGLTAPAHSRRFRAWLGTTTSLPPTGGSWLRTRLARSSGRFSPGSSSR
jgi:hypothetical protein